MAELTLGGMGRHNSIGFLRIAAAALVIVGHSFPYGGFGVDPLIGVTNNQLAIGRLPVDVFFVLSGFLIAQSYVAASSGRVFVWHRFLRIYPALVVCLFLTAFVLSPAMGAGPAYAYFADNVTLIPDIRDWIPGLFTTIPGSTSVNSSLWTLPWEIRAYGIILVLGLAGLNRIVVVLPLFLLSWGLFIIQILSYPGLQTSPAVTSGIRLMTFFLAGSVFYLLREKIVLRWDIFATSMALLVLATVGGNLWVHNSAGLFYIVAPLPLAYIVFFLAVRLPLQHVNSERDLSYGVYIYGTLVLNVVAAWGLNAHWGQYVLIAGVLTALLALASWYFIEKPALRLKNLRWSFEGGRLRFFREPRSMASST